MADAALARREARRRKILENSHNRLQLISGKNGNEVSKEPSIKPPISEPIHENFVFQESSISNKCVLNNGVINTGEPIGFMSTNHENFAISDGDVNALSNDIAAFLPATSEPTQSPPLMEKLFSYKYDIVLLSLLIQLFYSFSLVTFDNTYFFLPLLLYVTTKLIWFPKQPTSNFTNILLLLNGMSATRARRIIAVTEWISAFSHDICVFLFVTICVQSLCQSMRSNM
ncbi:uncharacterized protein LOC123660500 [Melitaea cinxia]|uniref:uncharacterized protein LOC123660500 n=1 Tax=Melitaea cinxia TaxID=113334 RepID=UPI0004EA76C9|nr:uncharacterized protein LOC123660500 [Melitaea cinxia]